MFENTKTGRIPTASFQRYLHSWNCGGECFDSFGRCLGHEERDVFQTLDGGQVFQAGICDFGAV
jgi:hypothetical protein